MRREAKRARFDANGGREGVAKRILEVAKQIVERDSYKRAVAGAGQMKALFDLCKADSYWNEKAVYGESVEANIINGMNKIEFAEDASLDWKTEVKKEQQEGGK